MEGEQSKSMNYLSIDGGPSGLPALYILEETFSRLQSDVKSDKELIPYRWFDLVIGTGRGAIVALLIGKLGLTVSKAIEMYMKLEPSLSVKPAKDDEERRRNTEAFRSAFSAVLSQIELTDDTTMLNEKGTKTIVCTANMVNVSTAHLIRSYPIRGKPTPPCTILDVACACVAFSDSFLPATIGTGHRKVTLVDAVAGYANPTKELLREAQKVFGEEAEAATIFSIGSGKWNVRVEMARGRSTDLSEALKQGVVSGGQVHRDLQARLLETAIYFRFNVDVELETEPEVILANTEAYLEEEVMSSRLDTAIRRIETRPPGIKLRDINSVKVVEIKLKPRPRLVQNFIGREDILEAMRYTHFINRPSQPRGPAISILSGLGGSGKTQTALKFALEFEEKHPGVAVYFLDASGPDKLKTDLETVIRSRGAAYHSKTYDDALVYLATELTDWLAILDNADDPTFDLVQYIPKCAHGHVIITTRNATHASLAPNSSHPLTGLPTSDAVTLVLTASSYPKTEENHVSAQKIVLELGCLPLALAHAAGYISVHRCLGTYLDIYRKNREKIWASTTTGLLHDYRSSVAMTIQISLEQLSRGSQDIMRIFAQLQASSIPYSIIQRAAERQFRRVEETEEPSVSSQTLEHAEALMKTFCPEGQWSEFMFNKLIRQCMQYSLLQLTTQGSDKFYSMHIIVQSYLQADTIPVHNHQPCKLVVQFLGSAVTIGDEYKYLAINRLLLPHIRLIQLPEVVEPGDHLGFGDVLRDAGDLRLSLLHAEKCVEMCKTSLGKEDTLTLQAMWNLAHIYSDGRRDQAAVELAEEVLELAKSSGHQDLDTVSQMNDLSVYYKKVGRTREALKLQEEALSLQRRLQGPEHPDTLVILGNLAFSYSSMGRNQEALKLDEEVMRLRKKLLGPEHPATLRSMLRLANSYSKVGRCQESMQLEETTLEMQMRLLGPEHPNTLETMWNLLISYDELDMQTSKLDLLKIAVPAYSGSGLYGVDHPETIALRKKLKDLSLILEPKSNRSSTSSIMSPDLE